MSDSVPWLLVCLSMLLCLIIEQWFKELIMKAEVEKGMNVKQKW